MSSGKDIIICGGGVIGLATAFYCTQKGHRVTILERGAEGHDGCSFGNAGMIVPSHFVPLAAPGMVSLGLRWMWNPESPFYIKPRLDPGLARWAWLFQKAATQARVDRASPLIRDLSFASRAEFEALSMEDDFGLVRKGLLMLCRTQHGLDDEARMALRANELGIQAQVLDSHGTALLDPGITMDIKGSVYFPGDCHLVPSRFMAALRRRLAAAGGVFRYNTEITGWRHNAGKIAAALTASGEITGDEFVLCGGSWSPGMVRELRLDIPMQAGKGYSVTHPSPRQLPQLCAIFVEARVAVTPMDGALRVGGTMEIAGLNEEINPRRVEGIIKSIPLYYPELQAADFRGLPIWRGLRPCAPDGMPYIGRCRQWQNLSTATGHAMMGLSLAPVTGRIMANVLSGEDPGFDLSLVQPDRFA